MAPSTPLHNPADDEETKVKKGGRLFFTHNRCWVPYYYRVSSVTTRVRKDFIPMCHFMMISARVQPKKSFEN